MNRSVSLSRRKFAFENEKVLTFITRSNTHLNRKKDKSICTNKVQLMPRTVHYFANIIMSIYGRNMTVLLPEKRRVDLYTFFSFFLSVAVIWTESSVDFIRKKNHKYAISVKSNRRKKNIVQWSQQKYPKCKDEGEKMYQSCRYERKSPH